MSYTEARRRLLARGDAALKELEPAAAGIMKVAKGLAAQLLKGKRPSFVALWGFHVCASEINSKLERIHADTQREWDILDAREREIEVMAIERLVNGTADAIAAARIAIGAPLNDQNFVRAVIWTLGPDQEKLITAAFDELAVRDKQASTQAKMVELISRGYSAIKEAA